MSEGPLVGDAAASAIRVLKAQFEALAPRFPQISHFEMQHARGEPSHPPFEHHLNYAYKSSLGMSSYTIRFEEKWAVWRPFKGEPAILWCGALTGQGTPEFSALAENAGQFLLDLRVAAPVPAEVRQSATDFGLPEDCLILPGPDQRWCRFLHWLAWSIGPQKVQRRTWAQGLSIPYGSSWGPDGFVSAPPHRYFSEIHNVCLRSCLALDWIMTSRATAGNGRAKPTESKAPISDTPESVDLPNPRPARAVALVENFKRLARDAQAYYDAVSELPYTGWGLAFEIEERIARHALRLLASAESVSELAASFPQRLIPRYIERFLGDTVATVKAQLERWHWTDLSGLDGEACIRAKIEAHDRDRRIPVLRAMLAWRSMPGVEVHEGADGLADEADALGLTPLEFPDGTLAATAEEQTWSLYKRWHNSPVLGPVLPTITANERDSLAVASDRIRGFAERLNPSEIEPAPSNDDRNGVSEDATESTPTAEPPASSRIKRFLDLAGQSPARPRELSTTGADLESVEPPESSGTGIEPDERSALTDSQRYILDAALKLGAIDRESRRSRRAISEKAGLPFDAGSTGAAFKGLRDNGFLCSSGKGRKSGTWLTAKGRGAAR